MQDEGDPLGRGQGVQHHQHGRADRVRHQGLVLGAELLLDGPDPVRQAIVQELLAARAPGPERIQADPGDHGGEPAVEVVQAGRVGAGEAQPGLLDGVVGFGGGAEQALGDRPQPGPVGLEPPGQPLAVAVLVLHVTSLRPVVSFQ